MADLLLAGVAAAGTFLVVLILELAGRHVLTDLVRTVTRIRSAHAKARRADIATSGKLESWLLRHHDLTAPQAGGLAVIENEHGRRRVPLYSPDDWWRTTPRPLDGVELVRLDQKFDEPDPGRTKPREIERRDRELGQSSWDGRTLSVHDLPTTAVTPIDAVESSFFRVAPDVVSFEEEALRCAQRGTRRPKHRTKVGILAGARTRGLGGLAVVITDPIESEPRRVLVHRRTRTVTTNPGLMCVLPTFFAEANRTKSKTSDHDLMTWNVLREFLEEGFSQDELRKPTRYLDPDWFLRSSDGGRQLEGWLLDGSMQMFHLGWYVNLLNGLLDFVVLVRVSGPEKALEDFRLSLNPSKSETEYVDWPELESASLAEHLLDPDFHNGSALAIQKTKLCLPHLPPALPD